MFTTEGPAARLREPQWLWYLSRTAQQLFCNTLESHLGKRGISIVIKMNVVDFTDSPEFMKKADQSSARCTWNGGDGFDEDY